VGGLTRAGERGRGTEGGGFIKKIWKAWAMCHMMELGKRERMEGRGMARKGGRGKVGAVWWWKAATRGERTSRECGGEDAGLDHNIR
jgi:hypothetical protein